MRRPFVLFSILASACMPNKFDRLEGDPGRAAVTRDAATAPGAGCGMGCPAPAAGAALPCIDGRCSPHCLDGFGDCDGDLARGADGNGCETNLDQRADHCGACGMVCPSMGDLASCREGNCWSLSLLREPPTSLATRGGDGGQPFQAVCPPGEVVTGIGGMISDDAVVDSMLIRCAPLRLVPQDSSILILPGIDGVPLPLLGADGGKLDDPGRRPYGLYCRPGEFVVEVQVATWRAVAVNDVPVTSIKDLALRCARASLQPNLEVTIEPSTTLLETGIDRSLLPDVPATWTTDRCAASALVGFVGHHGLHVDQLIGQCSALTIATQPE